jgi:phosphoheptose isomerase
MAFDQQELHGLPGEVSESFSELSRLAKHAGETLAEQIVEAGALIATCLAQGGKVLTCGNGGSAADAQHFAAELVGRLHKDRRPFPGISLTSDPSTVSALANDYGYENVFARQVEAFGQPGDVLVGISTSGRSPNVQRAVELARERELGTIALLGAGGDSTFESCDVAIHIPSDSTQRIQELHMAVLHEICGCAERVMGFSS